MHAGVTVWFDGNCPLCRREIRLMQRLDRQQRIRFVDLTTAEHCPLDRSTLLERFHAREAGGSLVSGAAAFAAMWCAIPALKPLGYAAKWPPCLWLLEKLYLGFLRFRPGLQKLLA